MQIEPSSFKDTDACVYIENDEIYRKFSADYKKVFDRFIESGLYTRLLDENLIIEHESVSEDTIKPKKVFISYPWEWCFSQLKDAALATLKIQRIALDYNMTLKDANCFNIQFVDNNPLLIDTSSFEEYIEGTPWIAYKQFCENFLAPLALMAYKDISLNSLFLSDINGISLELTSKLLPFKTLFNFNLLMHIHLHSKIKKTNSEKTMKQKEIYLSKEKLKFLIENLINTVKHISCPKVNTEWGEYYSDINYTETAFKKKEEVIENYRNNIVKPQKVLDLGANIGVFSRLFSKQGSFVYSFDMDRNAVQKNYKLAKQNNETNIMPLVFDLVNPSPALGWNNNERKLMSERLGNIDLTLALALIHHLRITYNIPLIMAAEHFSKISKYLIIEFPDKNDSKVLQMLANRKDIFDDYTEAGFEKDFGKFYNILQKNKIEETNRTIYLLEVKDAKNC